MAVQGNSAACSAAGEPLVDGELALHFGGQAGEGGGIVISVLGTRHPPEACPDFLVGSSQLTLRESTQVDEYIQI